MAESDQPREKMILYGRRHVSNVELVAILIASGSKTESAVSLSQRILARYDHDLYKLGNATVKELCQFNGIGEVKALFILAALELGRRRKAIPDLKESRITCSKDAFDYIHPVLADLNHEEFWILTLNAANIARHKVMISRGGRSGTIADPKIIFKTAMEHNAAYIVLAHNHPSGNLQPSEEDIHITRKLMESGHMLDLPVLDHLIVTNDSYCSLMDGGFISA